MASEFRLYPKAQKDMEAVWLYSMSQWGPEQAGKYVDDLAGAFVLLASNPKLGISCENIRPGYRKYPTLKHVIYYQETS